MSDGVRRPHLSGRYTRDLKQEDATCAFEVVKPGPELLSFIGVADGHGGPHTSRWLSQHIIRRSLELCAHLCASPSEEVW